MAPFAPLEAQHSTAQEVEDSLIDVINTGSIVNDFVAAAPVEIADAIAAIQSQGAPITPPPLTGPAEPQSDHINFNECRTRLAAFFKMRVYDKTKSINWSLRETLPRRGRDTEFDKEVDDLRLGGNRRYLSQKWLEFREARGMVPPPTFECSAEEIDEAAASLVTKDIVEFAIKKTSSELDGPRYDQCNSIVHDTHIRLYLDNEILRFTEQLKEALDGAKPMTIDGKVNVLLRRIKKDMRTELIKEVKRCFSLEEGPEAGIFFGELHQNLYDVWDSKIAQFATPDMLSDVQDTVIEQRLSGSEDKLYYISGWVLNKLLHLSMSGVDNSLLSKFVLQNSTSKRDAADMPCGIVDGRESRDDALKRPGAAWFQFICLLESIFLVNMNAMQVLHHRGRVLQKITTTARTSDALRQKFIECIPNSFETPEIKSLWRVYYLFLIPTYGALKSSDVIRRIRESRPVTAADKIPVRAYALAAQGRAKNAKQ